MTDKDNKRFAHCMIALSEAFSQDASPLKTEIYFKALSDISIEDIEQSTWKIINTRATASFPKVAELREAITGNPDDKAILAYDAFTRGKAQTGAYDSVCFEDKIIHAVVESLGGWQDVCLITEDEWKFKRKEFIDLYKAIGKHQRNEIPQKLIGLGEHGCSQNEDWAKYMPPLKLISQNGEVTVRQQQAIEHDKNTEQERIAE